MTEETRKLADFAASLRYEEIPAAVLERARNTIADTIGAMIYGYELPWSKMIVHYAESTGPGGKCNIMGPGSAMVRAPQAALANGSLAHAFELDGATKPSAGVHPCATVFPALLAIAQEKGISGRNVLTAFVAAAEVMIRIGRATRKSNEHRGFHAPGTTGPFGAAIGASLLLGLDAASVTNAIGIAASLSSGLVQFSRSGTGGMVKRLHFGRAAEGGVLAASLAADGFTGPHDVLEGEFGFLNVFCDEHDIHALTKNLGEEFLTLAIYMKRFACHGTAQAPLQALEEIKLKHAFSGEDVAGITVAVPENVIERHNITKPADPMLAQYSTPFCVALACYRDPRDPRSFDQSALSDAKIAALCAQVRLLPDEAHPGSVGLTVVLKDGSVLKSQVSDLKGSPEIPPSADDVYEKFSVLTRHCQKSRMEELFKRIQGLEMEPDLAWLHA